MCARNGLLCLSVSAAIFSFLLCWSSSVCRSTAPPAAAAAAATSTPVTPRSTFRVAVFEHIPVRGQLGDSRAKALGVIHENLGIYERQMARARELGAKLIVFPEWGLHGLMGDEDPLLLHKIFSSYTEEIPDCVGLPGCCFGTHGAINMSALETVARLARRYDMYVSVNLAERAPCVSPTHFCPPTGHMQYNTNLLVDRHGCLRIRHRKRHLLNEYFFNVPLDNAQSASDQYASSAADTEFGRIGSVICMDVICRSPTLEVIEGAAVDTLLVPVAWTDMIGDPLVAVRYHSALSLRFGVNVLVANLFDGIYVSGSGIYTPDGIPVVANSQRSQRAVVCNENDIEARLVVADIPIHPRKPPASASESKWPSTSTSTSASASSDAASAVVAPMSRRDASAPSQQLTEQCVMRRFQEESEAFNASIENVELIRTRRLLLHEFDPRNTSCVIACVDSLCCTVRTQLHTQSAPPNAAAAALTYAIEVSGGSEFNYNGESSTDLLQYMQWCHVRLVTPEAHDKCFIHAAPSVLQAIAFERFELSANFTLGAEASDSVVFPLGQVAALDECDAPDANCTSVRLVPRFEGARFADSFRSLEFTSRERPAVVAFAGLMMREFSRDIPAPLAWSVCPRQYSSEELSEAAARYVAAGRRLDTSPMPCVNGGEPSVASVFALSLTLASFATFAILADVWHSNSSILFSIGRL